MKKIIFIILLVSTTLLMAENQKKFNKIAYFSVSTKTTSFGKYYFGKDAQTGVLFGLEAGYIFNKNFSLGLEIKSLLNDVKYTHETKGNDRSVAIKDIPANYLTFSYVAIIPKYSHPITANLTGYISASIGIATSSRLFKDRDSIYYIIRNNEDKDLSNDEDNDDGESNEDDFLLLLPEIGLLYKVSNYVSLFCGVGYRFLSNQTSKTDYDEVRFYGENNERTLYYTTSDILSGFEANTGVSIFF